MKILYYQKAWKKNTQTYKIYIAGRSAGGFFISLYLGGSHQNTKLDDIVEVAKAVSAVFSNLSRINNVHAKAVVASEMSDAIINFQHGSALQLVCDSIWISVEKNISSNLLVVFFFFNNFYFNVSSFPFTFASTFY